MVEAEIASQDRSNARERIKTAAFPVTKTLDAFDVTVSWSPKPPSTTWPASNGSGLATIFVWSDRPAPGKAVLVALGHAAVNAGHRVRYFTASELAETLCRALADNSVGKTITKILRCRPDPY